MCILYPDGLCPFESREKLYSLCVSPGVPGLDGPATSIGISEGEPSLSSECWIMARRVGMSISDPVGVLGLEERWRMNVDGDGDEGRE